MPGRSPPRAVSALLSMRTHAQRSRPSPGTRRVHPAPCQLIVAERAALWIVRDLRGDFRDWEEIRSWAQSIAAHLSEATAA